MPSFAPKRQEQIYADIQAQVVAMGGLTDVTDSSGLKSLIQAFARQLDELYYQASLLRLAFSLDNATGLDLDARAAEMSARARLGATAATGTVIFSRPGTAGDVVIPQNTQVQTSDGTAFRTTEQVILSQSDPASLPGHAVGQDSPSVPIVATSGGAQGNVAAGAITTLGGTLSGINTVTNVAATTGGQDQESDDAYRAYLYGYVQSLPRATSQSIVSAVLGQTDSVSGRTVLFASALEDPTTPGQATLLIDDGSGDAVTTVTVADELLTQGMAGPPPNTAAGGERRFFLRNKPVYPDAPLVLQSSTRGALEQGADFSLSDPTGQILLTTGLEAGESLTAAYTSYTGLVALAQKIVDGDAQDPVNFPGYRAFGTQVTVRTPQAVTLIINAVLTISTGYDPQSVEAQVQSALTGYVNTLGIGSDVLRSGLIAAAMGVPGVINVVLTDPSADLIVLDDQIARVAQSTVTVT